jgi:DNA polymerase-4
LHRNIIHIHVPSFSITLERLNHPEYRGRPVVVAPPRSDRALILAVSSEARKEGIYKGMALGNALRFCPELTVLPPNPGLTEKGSRLLTRTVAEYTPIWEPSRPGHVYMDLTGTDRLWGRAKDAALRIRREIRSRLSLSGAVGVSGNKMVSSIASRLLSSEGVMDVDHGRESSFMAPLKVDLLPGVGHARKRVLLEELNITLVREIAIMDARNLKLIFGRQAWVIHQRSIGIDPTPVHPPASRPEVSEFITLEKDDNDDERLLGALFSLVEKCSRKLRTRGLIPRRAELTVRYSDQMENTRRMVLANGCYWETELFPCLEGLFFKTCDRRTGVRFMRIRFTDLSLPSSQLSLFFKARPEQEKRNSVSGALDRIRDRYGEKLINYGKAL